MPSLFELSRRVESGDSLAWVAAESMGEADQVHPRTVTNIKRFGESIVVEAEGIRGGEYLYGVSSDGNSMAFFRHPSARGIEPRGPVTFAELTRTNDRVTVRNGYFDHR